VTLLPRVFCSEAVIATVAEIDIHLLTIESWNDRVLVRTVGVMTEAAQAIVTVDEEESAAWVRRRRAGADEPPPEGIGGRLARSLTVDLSDDGGTVFRLIGRSTGVGGGAQLYCEWTFVPAMAERASSLTITVATVGGGRSTQTVTRK
jgi:hypothetical protein